MFMPVSSATTVTAVVLTYCAPMCPTIVPFQFKRFNVIVVVATEVVGVSVITTTILVCNVIDLLLHSLHCSGNIL